MASQIVGYIRVSTMEQNTDRQLADVRLDKVYEEKISGKDRQRPELQKMLENLRQGDTVMVHEISRLARSLQDLLQLVEEITSKDSKLVFKTENLTFEAGHENPTSTLMLSMLGSFAEFERKTLLQRQREGIHAAKARGAYKAVGRKPKLSDQQVQQVQALLVEGKTKAYILGRLEAEGTKITRMALDATLKRVSI